MTFSDRQTRSKNMIFGALVADAAALGTHWIYDQAHIAAIAPETPEFTPPLAKNYEGVMGFFAHGGRGSGAQSQYGEQALVMLRVLANAHGEFEAAAFAEAFQAHFGYGGEYIGYIDHATRDTLDNARRFEDRALQIAAELGADIAPRTRKEIVAMAIPMLARMSGNTLETAFEKRLLADYDDAAQRNFGMALLRQLQTTPRATGAVDIQLPATAKLPPLVAVLASAKDVAFDHDVASAVQTTSDHPVAAEYGRIVSHMMRAALVDGTVAAVTQAAQTTATGDAAALIAKALGMSKTDNARVTAEFGMACDLPYGVPSALHNIATAPDFATAVRRNIYGGGDTCGRAMIVGAVAGALYGRNNPKGIPQSWIDRLAAKDEVNRLVSKLLD